jgi:hypothetical protein
MSPRAKTILLLLLAVALLFGAGQTQKSLNRDRERLGLTHAETLDSAPPMLAFTTVALGGFRGLISNFLWIRANDLQIDDKFFEAAQLANWITDLEPHFSQVWVFQAWNMAFNISVKFKDFSDRWRWLNNGIELLRDRALRYNPDDVPIHRELAWFFQFKMGDYLDDANVVYKQRWAESMKPFFGPDGTNFNALLNPVTPEEKTNALLLREKYKIDPVFAKKVDEEWGPMDWRLPEAHAIYWATLGLKKAKENPGKVNADDLIQLRRVIYQSTLQSFHHGRIIVNPFTHAAALVPNLDLTQRANDTYRAVMTEDPASSNHIATAHRNFLRDAVKYLYEYNRKAEAAKWYKYLGEQYPDKTILDNDPNSYPRNLTLDEYVVGCVTEDVTETSKDAITGVVQGMLANAYEDLAIGQNDRAAGYQLLAQKVYERYQNKMGKDQKERVQLPPMDDIKRSVLSQLLDPQKDIIPFAARAAIRTQLGMPAETNAPASSVPTNSVEPPALPSTNAPPTT